jgi:hypothetical protein
LIESNDGVAVVVRFARAAKSTEDRIGGRRAVNRPAHPVEDRDARIDGLHDVVRADRQTVIRRVAYRSGPVRTFKANPEPVKRNHHHRRRLRPLRALLDGRSAGRNGENRWNSRALRLHFPLALFLPFFAFFVAA